MELKHYITMLIIALVVRFSPFSIGNYEIDLAINDVSIGAISSILIAMIIQAHNDKLAKDKVIQIKEVVYRRLVVQLVLYLQFFCNHCSYNGVVNKNKRLEFIEWSNLFINTYNKDQCNVMKILYKRW